MTCRKCSADLPQGALYCHLCGAKQQPDKQRRRTRANGMGTAYRRGRTWTAKVTIGQHINKKGKLVYDSDTEGGFKTKKEALEYCPTLSEKHKNGVKLNRDAKTFEHYWELYSKNKMQKLSGSKKCAYRIAYEKLSTVSDLPVKDTDIGTLQNVVNDKAPTYYPARDMKSVLSHLYKLAIGDGVAKTNLATLIDLPELDEEEGEPFSAEEIATFWKGYADGNAFIGYILLMIYSGMMPGELLKCKKDMINWGKLEIFGCGLKTKERKKKPIVIADFMEPVVRALCDFSAGVKLVTMNSDNFYILYHETLQGLGVRDLTPYSCRHTTATALALGQRVAPATIAKVLRQKNLKMQEHYIHPDMDDAHAAVNGLNP